MKYFQQKLQDLSVNVCVSLFKKGSVNEAYVMLSYTNCDDRADKQFKQLDKAIGYIAENVVAGMQLAWKRYFLSDIHNQVDFIDNNSCYSIVQQPPLNGTKAIVWLYYVSNAEINVDANRVSLNRPNYTHHYHSQLFNTNGGVEQQTDAVLNTYNTLLHQQGCDIENNCLRTWIYVQGVDIHYMDMVNRRTDFFTKHGLTADTHYITSTGIEGCHAQSSALFLMDAYAVKGLKKEQIKYLKALSHLSPTNIYGVTFERGTAVDYGDRRHIFISGTASIDNKGEIVHKGNVMLQLERTIENIEALLAEAEAGFDDIAQMILYLRDVADYNNVYNYIDKYYNNIPKAIVLAPVCRPGWLIEIECIAIKSIQSDYFDF